MIEEAKKKVLIPELWELRGWPGEPGRECRVPFRADDTRDSGSVFAKGKLFKDFKSGKVYDAPALLAEIEGIENGAACKEFIRIAGIEPVERSRLPKRRRAAAVPKQSERNTKPKLPELRHPTREQCEFIASQRGYHPAACELAAERGFLFSTEWRGDPSWALTDSERWNCQYRRLDGRPYNLRGRELKTLTTPGAWASWPIGAPDLHDFPNVLLVEGSTDFLAGWHLIFEEIQEDRVTVVAITGGGVWIPESALAYFSGRTVRIFPDVDTVGGMAAVRWETQLINAGARCHCFDLGGLTTGDGKPVKDLNDVLHMSTDGRGALGPLTTY